MKIANRSYVEIVSSRVGEGDFYTSRMSMDRAWPAYLVERARRGPPEDCGVVPGSTPVVSFGDPSRPSVATLGINPSSGEFLSRGRILRGDERRLATLESLGVSTYAEIDDALGSLIVDDCASYFQRRPYRWFKPLNLLLTRALGVSYYDGSASSLDIVQWATDPIWGQLNGAAQAQLLSEDQPFLLQQLQQEHYRLIIVNGRRALTWVESVGLVTWSKAGVLPGPPSADLYVSDAGSVRFVAWSCNVQNQPGGRYHIPDLERFLREASSDIRMS